MQRLIYKSLFEKAVLFDTGALYALINPRDQHHKSAKLLFKHIQSNHFPIFVTNAVIIEAYRLILHDLGEEKAIEFLNSISDDIENKIISLERMSAMDEAEGRKLISQYRGHKLTLTDAVNFSIMFRLGIYKMFGFDSDCCLVGFELYSIESHY